MTEPGAGSATTDLQTTATPDGAGFRINGQKVFPNPHADQYLVYVRYGPGVGGIGSVMLRRSAPGFSIGRPGKFMSGNAWAPIFFDNVYVPPEDVLLPAGGFKKQIQGFNAERVGNASRSLAYGRYCFNAARDYAMTRRQFGRPLCEFQGLQWKFADMKMKLEAAQLLLYRAAQETLVEYCLKRCRGWMIAGGSIEMLKNRLAEIIFERRFSQRPPKPEEVKV
jgi:alkylation response protein AidB-like acyl-CoA dehydrogenase